ncbi:MAG: hypothetical protein R3E08_12235 [Thiotrichaceae bacterium]
MRPEQLAKQELKNMKIFGVNSVETFKEGVIDDFSNKPRVAKLLRLNHSR